MKKLILIPTVIFTTLVFTNCKKTADLAPTRNLADGSNYSVTQLKAIATSTNSHRFTTENYFTGVVIADEISGNFYKEVYVRDAANTGGLHFKFLTTGSNLFIGDSVRLNLKNYDVNIDPTTQILEIDSVSFDKNIAKFASGANPQPIALTLADGKYATNYGDLVTINRVSFASGFTGVQYSDPIKQISGNNNIQDCFGNTVIVRTSNYALFGQQLTPTGFGAITGIATSYNGAAQMAIRTPNEVYMNGPSTCNTYITKNFNDNLIASGNWTQVSVSAPSVIWKTGTFGSVTSATISGFGQNAENWLISPSINLSAASNPILAFRTAAKYAGLVLEVWISSNYTTGLPSTGTWTQLSGFALSPNNATSSYVWTASGPVSLNAFKNANTHIAFRYTSTTTSASNWELDDIIVGEN